MMFMSILMMGTMISISANSWLGAWMGLEINLLAFIPLMSNNKLMSTESSLKYFLTQALASSILLFAIILILMTLKFNNSLETIIFSSLLLKSGSAPFHFWFPNVMEGLSWSNSLILMTWQKIAPLMLISYMIVENMMILSIIMSSLVGALGGLNQTSLQKLMAYSSINHLSWMLAAMNNNNMMFILYFLIYSFLMFSMTYMFNMMKIFHMNQLSLSIMFSKYFNFFLFLNLLSLGGLPPFLGFLPKWIVIQGLAMNNQLFLLMFMVMMTLITLYYYIRLCFSIYMMNYFQNNWMINSYFNMINMLIMMFCLFYSLMGLFLIYSMYFML
uniref:NADH-ubiquinone oxidoreductase chain 2 n=1 Tax=Strongygaster brasiliensis TaxID=1985198 RepID=A0A343YVR7_9MUSC|nr:NADH dehydrogenase subunit 2 [Strongygaster brasiliensis]